MTLAAAAAFTVRPGVAAAQSRPANDDDARALELFDLAAARFREGRFREAIELLDEASRLKPSAILHYNKARAFEGLGDKSSAVAEYGRYLEMEPSAADRGAVEQRIATLQRELDERAALERQRPPAAAAPPAHPAPSLPRRPSAVPWVVVGVGVAALGVGTYLGVRARSEESAGDEARSQVDAFEAGSRADDFATAANVAWIAGGALVLLGAVWGVIDLRASSASAARVSGARAGPVLLRLGTLASTF